MSMARRMVVTLVLIVGMTGLPAVAQACDTGYWNLGCAYRSTGQGSSGIVFHSGWDYNTIYTTHNVSPIRAIATDYSGNWYTAVDAPSGYSTDILRTWSSNDKIGCYNNQGYQWINCRRY